MLITFSRKVSALILFGQKGGKVCHLSVTLSTRNPEKDEESEDFALYYSVRTKDGKSSLMMNQQIHVFSF
jgi:hypothetical protein